jgi:hypothetical protein
MKHDLQKEPPRRELWQVYAGSMEAHQRASKHHEVYEGKDKAASMTL